MTRTEAQKTSPAESRPFGKVRALPGVLVAFAPEGASAVDRAPVYSSFTVGRGHQCDLAIKDDKVSKRHCRLTRNAEGFWIEDLRSTNGTFVNGLPVITQQPLPDRAVIRIGGALLVFHEDAAHLLAPLPDATFGMAGVFHTAALIDELCDAARSSRHILLTGPSGSGKELAANALAAMLGKDAPIPLLVHNAARFASEDEACVTLFGVAPRFFSWVDARAGLIETASGGGLFLDEIHNLPERVQRSLLRVIEDGVITRVGETEPRHVRLRFILASNSKDPFAGLAPDLFARLRKVEIPSLSERKADIPSIFRAILRKELGANGFDEDAVDPFLRGDHFESLVLDDFENENIRGLSEICDRILSALKGGEDPQETVARIFTNRYADGPVAARQQQDESGALHYEQNRETIIAAYRECGANLSATERVLKTRGLTCCRRVLAIYLKRWGVRQ